MRALSPSGRLFGLTLLATITFGPSGAGAAEHVVRIVSDYEIPRMAFVPEIIRIKPGDHVTWINEADEEHDVVTFPDGYPRGAQAFQSPVMTRAGERYSHRFDVQGTYEYHCMPHLPMEMQGVIIVGRPSDEDEFHEPSRAEIEAYRTHMLTWFDEDEVELLERKDRASENLAIHKLSSASE